MLGMIMSCIIVCYLYNKTVNLERKLDYVKFMTIMRQLCNAHTLKYTSKIIYNNSSYEIEYAINSV